MIQAYCYGNLKVGMKGGINVVLGFFVGFLFAIEIWILFIYLFYRYKDLSLLYFDGIAWFDLY